MWAAAYLIKEAAAYLIKEAAGAQRFARLLGAFSKATTDPRRKQLAELAFPGLASRLAYRVGTATPELGARRVMGILEPAMRVPEANKLFQELSPAQRESFIGSLPMVLPSSLAPMQSIYQSKIPTRSPAVETFKKLAPIFRQ